MSIARIVAHEWQTDGYLKLGKIVSVRRQTTEEFMSDVMGWDLSQRDMSSAIFALLGILLLQEKSARSEGGERSGGWLRTTLGRPNT